MCANCVRRLALVYAFHLTPIQSSDQHIYAGKAMQCLFFALLISVSVSVFTMVSTSTKKTMVSTSTKKNHGQHQHQQITCLCFQASISCQARLTSSVS